jgi:hypothetical protein
VRLTNLIDVRVLQELGKKTEDRTRTVVVKLEQAKKMIEESPAMMLDEKKLLRQACFKQNFKRNMLMKDHGKCSGMAPLADANHSMLGIAPLADANH